MAGKGVVKRKKPNFSATQMRKAISIVGDWSDTEADKRFNLKIAESEELLELLSSTPQTISQLNNRITETNKHFTFHVRDLLEFLKITDKVIECGDSVLISKWKRFTGKLITPKQRTRADFNNGI